MGHFIISKNSSSVKIVVPSVLAFSSLLPASSPAIKYAVFLETEPDTFPPNFSI